MKLDLPTLGFLSGLIYLTQVLAFLIQYRVNRTCRGIGWWLAGSACTACGFFFLSMGSLAWMRPLSMIGNPLLVAGRICLLLGVLGFLERRGRRGWIGGIFAATLAAYYYFLLFHVSLVGRTCTISAAVAVYSVLIAHALFTAKGDNLPTGTARFTGAVFLVHGLFLVLVFGFTLAGPAVATYQQYAPLQVAVFVLPALTSNLWTFGLILMVNQRLNQAESARSQLAARNRQLQKAESLGRMAGAVAHHFNNRLQAVLLNLDLAELPPAGAGDPGLHLRKARAATELAGEVSRQMLAYLGQTTGERELQDLAGICRGCLPYLRDSLPGGELAWELPAEGPVVLANGPELQQVLVNLVTNALEASAGPVQVRVSVRSAAGLDPAHRRFPIDWRPPATQLACLEVADAGPGIKEADLDQLFDPFFTTKFPGRGLGLSVALGIVQAHGGAITVASRPGQGSTFGVLLPLRPPLPQGRGRPQPLPGGGAPPARMVG